MNDSQGKIHVKWHSFGERLLSLRKSKGYKQNYFAQVLGIKPQSLVSLEKGVFAPSFETVLKIIEATGCDPAWLLFGEKAPQTADFAEADKTTGYVVFDDALNPEPTRAGEKDIRSEALAKIRVILETMEDADVRMAMEVMEALGRRKK